MVMKIVLVLKEISKSRCMVGVGVLTLLLTGSAVQAKYAGVAMKENHVVNKCDFPVYVVVREANENSCKERCRNSEGKVIGGGVVAKGESVAIEQLTNGMEIEQCHIRVTGYKVNDAMMSPEEYVMSQDAGFYFDKKHLPYPFKGKLHMVPSHGCCVKAYLICDPRCCAKKCVQCCPKPVCKTVCEKKCPKPCKPACPKPCKPKCPKPCAPKCKKVKRCSPCKPRCATTTTTQENGDDMTESGYTRGQMAVQDVDNVVNFSEPGTPMPAGRL